MDFIYNAPAMLPTPDEQKEFLGEQAKANLLHRFLAKFLDFLVVATLYEIPLQISFLFGLVYMAIADGLQGGSLGKRIIGLTVRLRVGEQRVSFRESLLRNIPFMAAYLLYPLPLIGWLIALGLVGFESFLILGNPQGIRFGDELAHTRVFDLRETSFSSNTPCRS